MTPVPPAPPRKREGDFVVITQKLAGQTALLLGWRPDEFWNATPIELATILAANSTDDAMLDVQTLADMMQQFPDAPPEVTNG
jgi:uncharacterized phage protein (TIGR02216 family)